MYEYEVQFFPINQVMSDELTDSFYKTCSRCAKDVLVTQHTARQMPKSLVDGRFHCRFCVTHGFDKRQPFMFSLRSLICHLYESHEAGQSTHVRYACQVADFIKEHREAGAKSFCLSYDDESFNWFMDCSLVGDGDGRIQTREVLKTVVEIISCFNPSRNSMDCRDVYREIKDGIEAAVAGKVEQRVIVPMLPQHRQSHARVRAFTPGCMR